MNFKDKIDMVFNCSLTEDINNVNEEVINNEEVTEENPEIKEK
jgi:hypothetical protein